MKRNLSAVTLLLSLVSQGSVSVAHAQEADPNEMIRQLLPVDTITLAPSKKAGSSTVELSLATKDEILRRLAPVGASRGIDPHVVRIQKLSFVPGHEAETLTKLSTFPSIQVAVSFQGSSDALSPEAGALLTSLSQALSDPSLAKFKFVVGVHTNSIGSYEYNRSLAQLRARAIVDQLETAHGIASERLFPVGFGRLIEPSSGDKEPRESIQVVNLGNSIIDNGASPIRPTVVSQTRPIFVARHHIHAASRTEHRSAHVQHVRPTSHTVYHVSPLRTLASHHRSIDAAPTGALTSVQQPKSSIEIPPPDLATRGSAGGNGGNGGNSGNGGGGSGGGGGWSDRRLKRRIRQVGLSPSGLRIYSFQYVWGGPVFVGVIAQELLEVKPEAVIQDESGYLMVDYSLIDVVMMPLNDWVALQPECI
jgi:outer membrane protein OmpA-like peptidoglycan-associated protein